MATQKKHLFIIDPLDMLDKKLDSSLQLMRALDKLGQAVSYTTLEKLYWNSTQKVAACTAFGMHWANDEWKVGSANPSSLSAFHVIHMRKDPPYDMRYVAATWLLESAATKTKIVNSPQALRNHNEKLMTFRFPEYAIPSLVSFDPELLTKFVVDECDGNGIIKPLDLYGGRGVERLDGRKLSRQEMFDLISQHTADKQWRVVQPFQEQIAHGEVRAFASFGEPIAWCLKVPKAGGYLANTRAGAMLQTYNPSKEELRIVTEMSQSLLKEGLYWVGYDIIGGKVSEINITSPRLLEADPVQYTKCFQKMAQQFVDFSNK